MQLKKEMTECQMKKETELTAKKKELAAPDWCERAGPRSKPTQKEREKHQATQDRECRTNRVGEHDGVVTEGSCAQMGKTIELLWVRNLEQLAKDKYEEHRGEWSRCWKSWKTREFQI